MQDKKPTVKKNIYLVGLMGTGKSTVGEILAQMLEMDFVDSDWEIEKKSKMSISQIFNTFGEDHFRKLEREFVEDGHPVKNCVVACGGGLCVPVGMMENLKLKGLVVCLWTEPETLVERTNKSNVRPLLHSANPLKVLQNLHNERASRYQEADKIIVTDRLSPKEIAIKIKEIIL